MSSVLAFKLVLLSLIAIIVLELVAKRLRLPPAAALLVGGAAMAFIPGLPPVNLDPDLVLIVFLPPLLMDGAYFSVWDDFKRNLSGILLLAVGAVAFTTFAVGVVAHWAAPGLPWAACFALGAIVSPPDAVAAKAVLERVALPRQLMVLLEGESLLNDAAGLVLFRFAVAAALTGAFSIEHATLSFATLAVGGVAVGWIVGMLVVLLVRVLDDDYLIIIASVMAGWCSYIAGDLAGVSGVIATVTCGMVLGWHQHEVFSAAVRTRGTAFWQVIVFLLEALVFVLIGLSLRGVMVRLGGIGDVMAAFAPAVGAVLGAVVLSRFVWVFGVDALRALLPRIVRRVPRAFEWRAATVVSWAGMRGVVTLAIALSLPEAMPGRDLILVAAFAVILVTVLLQGTTIGPLIRLVGLTGGDARAAHHLTETGAWARLEAAQLAAILPLVHAPDGTVIHPRLLEQYSYRARITAEHRDEEAYPSEARSAHYDVVLAAVAAGRAELLRMHRAGIVHDEMLHTLEHDLDLQEVAARHARG
ncbi:MULTISPECIES: Na+/H+ antiporter [Paraburkholderia]|uniref:Na+/H+ antiporter n=1 Tax=Paraburkholderia TaxID=1822464 RepID=UPI00225310A2|nr:MULTISPECIES: Na+/H+ antiporter [Paraburkholderia]MCX4162301.1 Na+/H+ antiporter [Paraburkholderia megapolitana]MDN7157796.1 Na+/H+ antiporter [Paraburkholderia sp. CHISQ3]MDQ6494843.1 Na+/H+ antiporter [Paraburkholderia megapolitana]